MFHHIKRDHKEEASDPLGINFPLTGENNKEAEDIRATTKDLFPPDARPVGGRLKNFVSAWEKIINNEWVLQTVQKGYSIEFITKHQTKKVQVDPETTHPLSKTSPLRIGVPELEGNIQGPGTEIIAPKLNMESVEGSMHLPKSTSLSGPSIDLPDNKIQISGTEKSPSQRRSPGFGLDLPSANFSAPKIKVKVLPDDGIHLKGQKLKNDVRLSAPKLEGDELDDIDIDLPSAKVNAPVWKEPFSGKTEVPPTDINSPQVKGGVKISPMKLENDDLTVGVNIQPGEVNAPTWKRPFSGQTEALGDDVNAQFKVPSKTNSPNIERDVSPRSKFKYLFSESNFSFPEIGFDISPPRKNTS